MDANYPESAEQIGQPDPLAPDYVGTYTPQAEYVIHPSMPVSVTQTPSLEKHPTESLDQQ